MKLKFLFHQNIEVIFGEVYIPLINCEVELILTWSENCVLADMTLANHPPNELKFEITDTKLYVPVITFSKENDIKVLEQLETGFKRTIKWNKYKSQMTVQSQNNNLSYLIGPTFINVNKLFVLSFVRNITGDNRDFFQIIKYQTLKLKILTS